MQKNYSSYTIEDGAAKLTAATIFQSNDWQRLPRRKQRLCGLSRTTILELCAEGKIKSAYLRKRHALRGIRLIFMPSLTDFLMANIEKQNKETHE